MAEPSLPSIFLGDATIFQAVHVHPRTTQLAVPVSDYRRRTRACGRRHLLANRGSLAGEALYHPAAPLP